MTDTIFAVSSGSPPAAIAVLRASGPAALQAAESLVGPLPVPRRATVRGVVDPTTGELLDRAIILVFPGPNTATGEDLVELHLHGGRAVVRSVESALETIEGLRRAKPGEFTRRALASGRIDLTEAEGLGDLLAAETEAQRRAAMGAAEGAVSRAVGAWTDRALALGAAVEAAIDYEDEEDASDSDRIVAGVRRDALALACDIDAVTSRPTVDRLRDGLRVVFAGAPNSGKSTLFNRMADREAAIVSPIAGTTRDRIEAPVVRDGIAWLLVDTAGLAEATDDPIERIGIERSREAMVAADVVLWLDDRDPPSADGRYVLVHARSDLPSRALIPPGRVAASGITFEGTDGLWSQLEVRARSMLPRGDQVALNDRQKRLCCVAAEHLRAAARERDILLLAEELRQTRLAFDAVTGRANVEAMLDSLFSRFCVGK